MANDLNRITVIGRLTRDVGNGFAYLANGVACANVSIAVNRSRKQGESWVDDVSYFDVTIWGKTAEALRPYLTKGKQIAVDGSLRQDRWEKDGQRFSKIHIVAENVQLLGGKVSGASGGQAPAQGDAPEPPDDCPF